MGQVTSRGVKYRATSSSYMRFGVDELGWLQYQNDADQRKALLSTLARSGLMISRNSAGNLQDDWLVSESGTYAGYLELGDSALETQTAVDANGFTLNIDGAYLHYSLTTARTLGLSVPNDSTWRTLVMRKSTTSYETGSLAFSSNTTLVGTGTAFTRMTGEDEGAPHGTYIRISASDNATLGNYNGGLGAGIYALAAVASDTAATLSFAAPTTIGNIPFSLAGDYYPSNPASSSRDSRIYVVPDFELVTRTRLPSNSDIVLADVRRVAGVMEIIDRRECSLGYTKQFTPLWASEAALTLSGSPGETLFASSGNPVVSLSLAETTDRRILGVRARTASVSAAILNLKTGAVATATVVAPAACTGASVVKVPVSNGTFRHLCFYDDTNVVYVKASTDSGATWGAASLVWDSSAVSGTPTLSEPVAILLRSHRLAVVAIYAIAGDEVRRVVVSDDYGATWSTNSNEGWSVARGTSCHEHSITQDPVTGYIWTSSNFTSSPPSISVTLLKDETLVADAARYDATFSNRFSDAGDAMTGPGGMLLNSAGQVLVVHGEYDASATATYLHCSRVGFVSDTDESVHLSNRGVELLHSNGNLPPRAATLRMQDGSAWVGYFDQSGGNYTGIVRPVSLN